MSLLRINPDAVERSESMSTDFSVCCHTCLEFKHLGVCGAVGPVFGHAREDEAGRRAAADFIFEHLGHDLRIADTDAVPAGFAEVTRQQFGMREQSENLWRDPS